MYVLYTDDLIISGTYQRYIYKVIEDLNKVGP